MECPIANALDEVGDGWSLLLLRNAFLGFRFFAEFEGNLGIPASTLTRRLDALCKRGLLQRRRYETHPPRDEYVLTEKGLELLPVLLALAKWGSRWLAPPQGPALVPVDTATGEPLDPVLVDARTKKELRPGHVALSAGPGASKRTRDGLAVPRVLGRS